MSALLQGIHRHIVSATPSLVRTFRKTALAATAHQDDSDVCKAFIQRFTRDSIPENKLSVQYSRSSGPGGQNVNKVNTKVDIRFTVYDMEWVPQPVVQRILEQNQGRMNKKGELVVTSDRFRTQHMNYNDCIDKIYDLIAAASQVSDGPSTSTLRRVDHFKAAATEQRLKDKRFRSTLKAERQGSRRIE